MSDQPVIAERAGSTLRVTLNRPERRNALDLPAWGALRDTLRATSDDPSIRVVVISGAGTGFCTGMDLGAPTGKHPAEWMRFIGEVAQALHDLPQPVITVVNGIAAGAGANLAIAGDFVVASSAARFSEIFTARGLSIDFGGSWLLPRLVGPLQAKRLALLGDIIGADEAASLGLVTWVKEPEEIDGFVDALAQRIAAMPPKALSETKRLLNQALAQDLRQALENEARAQVINLATTDSATAIAAFVNKEPTPEYTGKWGLTL